MVTTVSGYFDYFLRLIGAFPQVWLRNLQADSSPFHDLVRPSVSLSSDSQVPRRSGRVQHSAKIDCCNSKEECVPLRYEVHLRRLLTSARQTKSL